MRVLEIGAGTGWLAAIMAAAGATVTTIEIAPDLADHARRALDATGYGDVTVIIGDGQDGYPEHVPYDRVIASAAVHTVPYSWVEQTAERGRLVLPYTGELNSDALLVLNVRGAPPKATWPAPRRSCRCAASGCHKPSCARSGSPTQACG